MPSYRSFCWSLGTTSFRMVEFNRKIEQQLELLDEFWRSLPEGLAWSASNAIQTAYYEFLKKKNFIEDKDAPRKDKDARQKTSGLADLGLISAERRLTEAGKALLSVASGGMPKNDNILMLPDDSFIYFKQLLKMYYPYEGQYVRPYVVLVYLLSVFGELGKPEFTYLLPLAINRAKTERVAEYIRKIRAGLCSVDDALTDILFEMDNYREAEKMFLSASAVDDGLIMEVGMNRKSRFYDIPYTELYHAISAFRLSASDSAAADMYAATNRLSGRARLYWKTYLFNTVSSYKVRATGAACVRKNRLILSDPDDMTFKREFIRLMHLFKAKSTLDDYYDLNKRYFKLTDTVVFKDNKVRLDIIPNCYFSLVQDCLKEIAFSPAQNLGADCELKDISKGLDVTRAQILRAAQTLYGGKFAAAPDIDAFVEKERYARLNDIIDSKFTDDALVELLTLFENRNDDELRKRITSNADVPTMFEYVLAIIWYKVSGRQGKVLDYMNLSLDSDLLPITHAAGGREDITYRYEACEAYPAHTLLLEATLAGGTNQRRMEMEPVSRHLGEYMLSHPDEEAYCLFATTYLNLNVISDFRSRKNAKYYTVDGTKAVDGMKIIPCQTSEIKAIIKNGLAYADLYRIFEAAHSADLEPNEWYAKKICALL